MFITSKFHGIFDDPTLECESKILNVVPVLTNSSRASFYKISIEEIIPCIRARSYIETKRVVAQKKGIMWACAIVERVAFQEIE